MMNKTQQTQSKSEIYIFMSTLAKTTIIGPIISLNVPPTLAYKSLQTHNAHDEYPHINWVYHIGNIRIVWCRILQPI